MNRGLSRPRRDLPFEIEEVLDCPGPFAYPRPHFGVARSVCLDVQARGAAEGIDHGDVEIDAFCLADAAPHEPQVPIAAHPKLAAVWGEEAYRVQCRRGSEGASPDQARPKPLPGSTGCPASMLGAVRGSFFMDAYACPGMLDFSLVRLGPVS